MRILVIGGAGFIGVNVAQHYLKKKFHVGILDNFSRAGSKDNSNWLKGSFKKRLNVVRADIRYDKKKLKKLINSSDVVFHMAAQTAVTTAIKSPRLDFDTNLAGTFNILEAIRESKNRPILFYASTNKVYGPLEDIELKERKNRYDFKIPCKGISEKAPLDLYSPYGCSKGAAEQYTRDYSRIYGLKTVIFRQSCVYGQRQFGVEDQGWVAYFVISSILDRPLTIYGNGKQSRDILFIDDLIRAFDLALSKIEITSGNAYNIGGGRQNKISLLELINCLKNKLKKEIQISFSDWRAGDQLIFVSDNTKAKKDFGWEPKIDKNEGIKKLIDWVNKSKRFFKNIKK